MISIYLCSENHENEMVSELDIMWMWWKVDSGMPLVPLLRFQKAAEDDKLIVCSLDNGSGKRSFCAIHKWMAIANSVENGRVVEKIEKVVIDFWWSLRATRRTQ